MLFHLNNFILLILIYKFGGINNFAAFWFFTPFIAIFFTSFVVEDSKVKSVVEMRKLAISDFIIRCFTVLINFFTLSDLLSVNITYLIVINIVFLTANLYVEWKMMQHVRNINANNKEEDNLSKEEVNNLINDYVEAQILLKNKTSAEKNEAIKSFHSLVYAGYSNIIMFTLIFLGVFSFRILGSENRSFIFSVASLLLIIYLILNEKKIKKYYTDEKKMKLIKYRDNITGILGLAIIYILQGIIHIGESTFNFLGIFLAVILFIPTFHTNQKIKEYFHKVNKK